MIFFGSGTCWLQSADSNVNLITDYFDLYINTTKLSHMFICEATKWTGTQRFKAFFIEPRTVHLQQVHRCYWMLD